MKYVHHDVIDNGLAYLQNNAIRVLLLPSFSISTTYSQAVASALLSATISSSDFTLSNEGTGRKIVFGGTSPIPATAAAATNSPLHVAFTDGVSRLLWVDEEASLMAIVEGHSYRLPQLTQISYPL